MSSTVEFRQGGYSFIKGVFQYSAGVVALPDHEILRVRFRRPVPLAVGFARMAAIIRAAARPLNSLCACELRSPKPFTEEGFRKFNEEYVGILSEWDLLTDGMNPVARSNVCPAVDPPPEPSFHAFAFTRPAAVAPQSFIVAGGGEAAEGKPNYQDHIVAKGDISLSGMRKKVRYVLAEMEARMAVFGARWRDTTGVQLYTVQDIHPFLAKELTSHDIAHSGLTWQFCRPPIVNVEFEMDCRSVAVEHVLSE